MTPEEAWEALVTGRLGLQDIPVGLASLYTLGYDDGVASTAADFEQLQDQLERAESDADRLHLLAYATREQAAAARLHRMDDALRAAADRGELQTIGDDVRVAVQAAQAPKRPAA